MFARGNRAKVLYLVSKSSNIDDTSEGCIVSQCSDVTSSLSQNNGSVIKGEHVNKYDAISDQVDCNVKQERPKNQSDCITSSVD